MKAPPLSQNASSAGSSSPALGGSSALSFQPSGVVDTRSRPGRYAATPLPARGARRNQRSTAVAARTLSTMSVHTPSHAPSAPAPSSPTPAASTGHSHPLPAYSTASVGATSGGRSLNPWLPPAPLLPLVVAPAAPRLPAAASAAQLGAPPREAAGAVVVGGAGGGAVGGTVATSGTIQVAGDESSHGAVTACSAAGALCKPNMDAGAPASALMMCTQPSASAAARVRPDGDRDAATRCRRYVESVTTSSPRTLARVAAVIEGSMLVSSDAMPSPNASAHSSRPSLQVMSSGGAADAENAVEAGIKVRCMGPTVRAGCTRCSGEAARMARRSNTLTCGSKVGRGSGPEPYAAAPRDR